MLCSIHPAATTFCLVDILDIVVALCCFFHCYSVRDKFFAPEILRKCKISVSLIAYFPGAMIILFNHQLNVKSTATPRHLF